MSGHVDLIIDGMGTVPYQEVRGSTLYVQLGGGAYAGGIEITVTDGVITDFETMLITEETAAGLKPNPAVTQILADEGRRLAAAAAQQAADEAAARAEEEAARRAAEEEARKAAEEAAAEEAARKAAEEEAEKFFCFHLQKT